MISVLTPKVPRTGRHRCDGEIEADEEITREQRPQHPAGRAGMTYHPRDLRQMHLEALAPEIGASEGLLVRLGAHHVPAPGARL
jgi:hypothetical protein